MKLKQSKVFKAGIGYTIGNVMVKGINFLAIPIFSRLLTTEEMGLYTVFAAYEAVLFVFIGMALHSSIRSAKYEFEGKIDDFTSSIMGIYWINLIVALFISIVFNKILTKLLDLDLVTLVMLVIYSFGIAVVTLYNARISLDYEYKKYIKVSLASTIGNVGLSLILIKTIFNSSRGFGRVLGITISTVLVTVYIIYDLYKSARPTFRKKYWKFGIKYSLPIIPHGISQVLLGVAGSTQRCALLGVAHSHDVGIAGHHADGVGHALAFAGAGHVLTGKAQHMAAQVQHGGLKRKAGAGGRLIEQGGQFFVGGHILIGGRIVVDAVGKVEQGGDFLLGEIQRVDQMTHGYVTSVTSKRFKAVCVKWKNQRSLCSSSANASPGDTND